MYRTPPMFELDPNAEPFHPSGDIEFKVVYGGWEKCLEGIGALMGLKINFELKCPGMETLVIDGEEQTTGRMTWIIKFRLPQNYRVPRAQC